MTYQFLTVSMIGILWILETESSERLTLQEQQYVSEDQKHSSKVAQVFYKKSSLEKWQLKEKCMDKMTANGRSGSNKNLISLFNNIDNEFDKNVLEKSRRIIEEEQRCSSISREEIIDPYQPMNDTPETDDHKSSTSKNN